MYGIHAKNCSLAETFEFAKSHQNSYENEEEGPSRLKIWSLAWQLRSLGKTFDGCLEKSCLLISKLSFWPSRIIGRKICRKSVKMLWKTEEKSWEIFTSSEVRCHHPSQSRWVIENDGDFYTDQSAWEWSSYKNTVPNAKR